MTYPAIAIRRAAGAAAILLLAGCTDVLGYNPAYLAAVRQPPAEKHPGNALIYTTPEQDAYVFSGHPTSVTGSGRTTEVALGAITREAARAAFADALEGGAAVSNSLAGASAYSVVVSPTPKDFTHQYNQLRNLGFAITPIAELTMDVRVLNAQGATVWQRSYPSGEETPGSYMVNFSFAQDIDRAAHKAAYDTMARAAHDIVTEVMPAGHVPGS